MSPQPSRLASRRAQPSSRSRSFHRTGDRAPGLASLLESGSALARTVREYGDRLSAVFGAAPLLVSTLTAYARRNPFQAAVMTLGFGGFLYLTRSLLGPRDEAIATPPDLLASEIAKEKNAAVARQ